MSMYSPRAGLAALLCLTLPLSALAQESAVLKEDEGHVARWNRFTEQLHQLHKRQIAKREVRVETSLGGYAGRPTFYRQEVFVDADSGKQLSMVQWEQDDPDTIHSIAVFRHDAQGRVVRDYSSTYLPDYRNAPTQTLAFLHHYPAGVHAYRSFDASGELLSERCVGEFNGKPVSILLDIDEIDAARGERYTDHSGIMTTAEYRHCFADLPETADSLLPPH